MIKPMEIEIARKCFASLILDYEFEEDPTYGFEPFASGRVLVDGWFKADITAKNREELIAKFERGEY